MADIQRPGEDKGKDKDGNQIIIVNLTEEDLDVLADKIIDKWYHNLSFIVGSSLIRRLVGLVITGMVVAGVILGVIKIHGGGGG